MKRQSYLFSETMWGLLCSLRFLGRRQLEGRSTDDGVHAGQLCKLLWSVPTRRPGFRASISIQNETTQIRVDRRTVFLYSLFVLGHALWSVCFTVTVTVSSWLSIVYTFFDPIAVCLLLRIMFSVVSTVISHSSASLDWTHWFLDCVCFWFLCRLLCVCVSVRLGNDPLEDTGNRWWKKYSACLGMDNDMYIVTRYMSLVRMALRCNYTYVFFNLMFSCYAAFFLMALRFCRWFFKCVCLKYSYDVPCEFIWIAFWHCISHTFWHLNNRLKICRYFVYYCSLLTPFSKFGAMCVRSENCVLLGSYR